MRLAILVLLAAAGLAQEPEPKPQKQRLIRGEWDHLVSTIRKSGETTVKQLEMLKAAASKHLVVETAKIVDVEPADNSAKGAVHIVIWSRSPISTPGGFIFTKPKDYSVAKKWSRWDRISWVCIVTVRGVDRIELAPVFRGVADLTRTPNPGIKWPKFTRARKASSRCGHGSTG